MRKILFLVFLAMFAIFLIVARRNAYSHFREAEINGTIDTIYRYRDYVMININKDEFRIIPKPLNRVAQLDDIALDGDSLFKKSDNDTLNLIHKGDKYLYTVQKY
jgi:hypothetical protein